MFSTFRLHTRWFFSYMFFTWCFSPVLRFINDQFPEVVEAADCITDARGKDGSIELLNELLSRA